ncbi:hypothetical protein WJX72_002104 [[Myrmecia] bisecta]|uniref:Uncharacterized protein n=1 Tax=[Myrmecia] bisecta TaxID=41462 RepID=A0AAW1R4Z6_9CHLO
MGAVHRSSVRQHSKPNRRWNDDEQAKLKELVEAAKESAKDPDKIRWSQIAAHIPDRTGKQCRERWLNHTRDGINKSKWTDVEEYRLAQLHCQFGTHWTSIAKQLLGRTENATKNHWTSSFRSKTAREPSFFADFVRELKCIVPLSAFNLAGVKHQALMGDGSSPLSGPGSARCSVHASAHASGRRTSLDETSSLGNTNHMDSAAGPRASDYDLMTMDDPLIGFKVPDNDHQISTGVDQRLGQPRGTIAHDSNHFIPLKGRCILTGGGRSPPGMPAMHPTMSRHTCPPDFFGGLDQHSTRSRGSGDGLQGATSAGAGMPGLQGGNKSGMHGGFHHALSEPMASAIAELQAQHQKRTVMERAAHEELAKQPGMSDLQALIGAYGSPALLDPKFHISSLPARLHHDGLLSHSHEQLLQRPSPFACDQGRSGHVGAGNGSPMGTMGLPPRMDRARSLNSASPHLQPPHRLSQQGTAPKRQCQGRSSSIISRSQSFPDEDLPRPATSPPLPPHQLPSCAAFGSGLHMEEGLHSADPDATLPFGSVTLFPMRDRVGGGAGSGFSADPSNTVANASTPGKVSSDYWGPSASFSGCL